MKNFGKIVAIAAAAAVMGGCATDNVAWHDANHLNYEHPPQGIYTAKTYAPQLGSAMPAPGNYDIQGGAPTDQGVGPGDLRGVHAVVAMAPSDLQFMRNEMSEGVFVVNAGEEALRKSSDAHVQAVARQTIAARRGLNKQLADLAAAKGLDLPERMDPEHQKMMDGLKAANGADFNRLYISQVAHVSDSGLAELQNEATYGQDPDLRSWADATTPWVQGDLTMITTPEATTSNFATVR